MRDPVKQHVVPRSYLKQWADPDNPPFVWMFKKNLRRGEKKSPKKILRVDDLYTLKFNDGTKDYRIETQVLQNIENEYAIVYDTKISKRLPLNEQEHIILCAFVALMVQRTLAQKENIENFYDQLVEKVEAMEKYHKAPPKESLRLKKEKVDAHKKTMVQLLPDLTALIFRMNLAFLCIDEPKCFFITTDEPCRLFNPVLQWQRFYGYGFGQKNIEVTMPLSPAVKVLFSWSNYRGYCRISKTWVEDTNRMTRGNSKDYFISCSPKIKRSWYRRYPLSLPFIIKILWNTLLAWFKKHWINFKYHGYFRKRKV